MLALKAADTGFAKTPLAQSGARMDIAALHTMMPAE